MRHFIEYFVFCSVFASFCGCTPKSIIGHYTNKPKNGFAFAGNEFIFEEDGRFNYSFWTDHSSIMVIDDSTYTANEPRYTGPGSFEVIGDTILLKFDNMEENYSSLVMEKPEDKTIAYQLNIQLLPMGGKHSSQRNRAVHVRNKEGITYISAPSDMDGNVKLTLYHIDEPRSLLFPKQKEGKYMLIDLEKLEANEYHIPNKEGFLDRNKYYQKDKEVKIWFERKRKGLHYKRENGRIVKLRKVD